MMRNQKQAQEIKSKEEKKKAATEKQMAAAVEAKERQKLVLKFRELSDELKDVIIKRKEISEHVASCSKLVQELSQAEDAASPEKQREIQEAEENLKAAEAAEALAIAEEKKLSALVSEAFKTTDPDVPLKENEKPGIESKESKAMMPKPIEIDSSKIKMAIQDEIKDPQTRIEKVFINPLIELRNIIALGHNNGGYTDRGNYRQAIALVDSAIRNIKEIDREEKTEETKQSKSLHELSMIESQLGPKETSRDGLFSKKHDANFGKVLHNIIEASKPIEYRHVVALLRKIAKDNDEFFNYEAVYKGESTGPFKRLFAHANPTCVPRGPGKTRKEVEKALEDALQCPDDEQCKASLLNISNGVEFKKKMVKDVLRELNLKSLDHVKDEHMTDQGLQTDPRHQFFLAIHLTIRDLKNGMSPDVVYHQLEERLHKIKLGTGKSDTTLYIKNYQSENPPHKIIHGKEYSGVPAYADVREAADKLTERSAPRPS